MKSVVENSIEFFRTGRAVENSEDQETLQQDSGCSFDLQ